MRYIKCTYNKGQMPKIDGLQFMFALESEYPTDNVIFFSPKFFCTIPDDAKIDFVAGVINEISEAEFNAAHETELAARLEKAKHIMIAALAEELHNAENRGISLTNGMTIGTTIQDRANLHWFISEAPEKVKTIFLFKNGMKKCTAKELREVSRQVSSHIGHCYRIYLDVEKLINGCDSIERLNNVVISGECFTGDA